MHTQVHTDRKWDRKGGEKGGRKKEEECRWGGNKEGWIGRSCDMFGHLEKIVDMCMTGLWKIWIKT